jgi:hypothetical protein
MRYPFPVLSVREMSFSYLYVHAQSRVVGTGPSLDGEVAELKLLNNLKLRYASTFKIIELNQLFKYREEVVRKVEIHPNVMTSSTQ